MRAIYFAFVSCVLSVSFTVCAAEDCPPAAEVAELQNPNLYKDCDYSNEGLNGMLHRAFAKKKEEDSSSSQSNLDAQSIKSDQSSKITPKVKKARATQSKSFKTVSEMTEGRASLVWQQMLACKGVLSVVTEQYRSVESGYELLLTTECQ